MSPEPACRFASERSVRQRQRDRAVVLDEEGRSDFGLLQRSLGASGRGQGKLYEILLPMCLQPHHLHIRRLDPARNMARFYEQSIEPTLQPSP
ncbi:hypothetical protein LH464_19185 [Neorhizobium sp. T786]|uniref:hypothetical protein n=1 Tax=Pseudorhizobium xiangyangii TaxID=2883104 RepID=UPI001CFF63E5|nr:hypothetical protein [Neorhizobium xiangyangii]MCB5204595.1 hypothetical protein [Neorhizobium xiangyangii]